MKKVIVGLIAMVVLIVGTAVGVAVSASHLKEKELLEAKDVWVALASQGLLAWPSSEDYSDLAAGGVVPTVYRAEGMKLLVYVFADASQRERAGVPLPWQSVFLYGEERTIRLGSYRNVVINMLVPWEEQSLLSEEPLSQRELARLQAYFVRMDQQVTQQRDSLLYILNDVQTEILQVETDRMIYTIKQVAYCMPTETVLKGRLYDNWVKAQLLDCQYKELPKSQQLTAMISFKIGIGDESSSIENDGLIGDGQGVFKPRSMQGGRQVLKKEPAEVTYEIVFARGGLEDEAVLTVSLGE